MPLVGWIVLLVFMFLDSQPGTNAYGPKPEGGRVAGSCGRRSAHMVHLRATSASRCLARCRWVGEVPIRGAATRPPAGATPGGRHLQARRAPVLRGEGKRSIRAIVKPLLILVFLPVLIGVVSNALFRAIRSASFFAILGAPIVVYLCFKFLDPEDTWSWFAALLVSPLVMSMALVTVLVWFGRHRPRKRSSSNGA